jgi:hypothetical protein
LQLTPPGGGVCVEFHHPTTGARGEAPPDLYPPARATLLPYVAVAPPQITLQAGHIIRLPVVREVGIDVFPLSLLVLLNVRLV